MSGFLNTTAISGSICPKTMLAWNGASIADIRAGSAQGTANLVENAASHPLLAHKADDAGLPDDSAPERMTGNAVGKTRLRTPSIPGRCEASNPENCLSDVRFRG
jgi:hypothetical protein